MTSSSARWRSRWGWRRTTSPSTSTAARWTRRARCTLHFETRTGHTDGVGSAALQLVPDSPTSTTLQVDIAVTLDGVLGVLGAPLIELAAHEMARQFFQGLRALASARGRVTRATANANARMP